MAGSIQTNAANRREATQGEIEAASSNTTFPTPGRMHFHPGVAKWWFKGNVSGSALASYNVTSLTDTGTGDVAVTIGNDFSGADWCCVSGGERTTSTATATNARDISIKTGTLAAGSVSFECWDKAATTNALKDPGSWHAAGFGDL